MEFRTRITSSEFWRGVVCFLCGGMAFVSVTFVCFRFGLNLATVGLLYLMIIVLVSLYGSFLLSAFFSVTGVACLAYYFAPPIFSVRMDDPFNGIAVLVFLAVSAVVTGLVSRVKHAMETPRAVAIHRG